MTDTAYPQLLADSLNDDSGVTFTKEQNELFFRNNNLKKVWTFLMLNIIVGCVSIIQTDCVVDQFLYTCSSSKSCATDG